MSEQQTYTRGPYTWRRMGGWCLTTTDRGALIVMDFEREGMQGAQPRFSDRIGDVGGIMHTAKEIGDLNTHPDARNLAAAGQMRDALGIVLSWMTNANTYEDGQVANVVLDALAAAGVPGVQLFDAIQAMGPQGAAPTVSIDSVEVEQLQSSLRSTLNRFPEEGGAA